MPPSRIIRDAAFDDAHGADIRQARPQPRVLKRRGGGAASDPAAGETFKLSRVLRGGQVREAAHPFTLVAFDQEPRAPLPALPETDVQAPPEDEATEPPEALLAAQEAAWRARLEEEVAQARAQAYEAGHAAAQEELRQTLEHEQSALAEHARQLQSAWRDVLKRSEGLLADVAFEVAETLLGAPLPPSLRGLTTAALAEAIEELAGEPPLRIALHPVDFLQMQESGLVERFEEVHSGLVWEPDPDMRQGDWVMQSPVAAIRRFQDELIGEMRRRFTSLAIT